MPLRILHNRTNPRNPEIANMEEQLGPSTLLINITQIAPDRAQHAFDGLGREHSISRKHARRVQPRWVSVGVRRIRVRTDRSSFEGLGVGRVLELPQVPNTVKIGMMQKEQRLQARQSIDYVLTYEGNLTYIIWRPRRAHNAGRPSSGRACSSQVTTHDHVDVGMKCLGLLGRVLETDKVSDVTVDGFINV
jgi:hypothetical protein